MPAYFSSYTPSGLVEWLRDQRSQHRPNPEWNFVFHRTTDAKDDRSVLVIITKRGSWNSRIMAHPSLTSVELVSDPRPLRVFLLSPANSSAIRGQLLLNRSSALEFAHGFQKQGAPLGEIVSFISSLYFRGKLAYAVVFCESLRPACLQPWP